MRRIILSFVLAAFVPVAVLWFVLARSVEDIVEDRTLGVYGDTSETLYELMAKSLLGPDDFAEGIPDDTRAVIDAVLGPVSEDLASLQFRDRSGQILYAWGDDADQPPRAPSEMEQRALAGEPQADFVRDDDGSAHARLVLPVTFEGDDRVYGTIVAVGADTALFDEVSSDVTRVRWILAVGLLALLASLLPVIDRIARRLRRQARENEHLALHDTLTSLPNRDLLADRIDLALAAQQRSGDIVGVLLMDLDRFKEINDSLGHAHGDSVLVEVARRVSDVVRPADTVARLGGDEFAIVIPDLPDPAEAEAVARRISDALGPPITIGPMALVVEASIGIALAPEHGTDGVTLLQRADVAMYSAKESHFDYQLYDPDIDHHSPAQLSLAAELRAALREDCDELVVHFQPVANARTGSIEVVEALVRWNHPHRGELPPAEFLPLAERSGLIQPLTTLVLEQAVAKVADWLDRGLDTRVAVNLSARNLQERDLPERIGQLLHTHRVPPDRLELEITETAVLANPRVALELLDQLRVLGVTISLDDFGTGYSSLTYLRSLAADQLKVDQSFVRDMSRDATNANIVRSLIDLAHSLDMGVTAEGVETEGDWRHLTALSCDLIQGYYLSHPLAPDQIDQFLLDQMGHDSPAVNPR